MFSNFCFFIVKGGRVRVVGDWGAVGARARLDLETGAAWIWKPPTYPSVRCIFHFWDMETTFPSIPCGYWNHPSGILDRWDASLADKESAAFNSALHLSTLEDGKHLTKVDIDSTCYTWPVIHFCFFSNLISEHSSKAKIRVKFSFPVFRLGMTLVAVHTCFYCFTAPYLYLELFGWGEGPFYWALAT